MKKSLVAAASLALVSTSAVNAGANLHQFAGAIVQRFG